MVEVNDQNNPRPIAFVPNLVFEGVVKYEHLEHNGDIQLSPQPTCFSDGETEKMRTTIHYVLSNIIIRTESFQK